RSSSSSRPSVESSSARTPAAATSRRLSFAPFGWQSSRKRMHGPDIAWYVVLAAMLFAIGAVGVLVRRSPLIILLSVEIMLNGANLALIAFARHVGHEDGQVFAIAVMAVAASEVVVGLGLIVAMGRRNLELDVDKLRTLRG